ncbi:hypothetical protein P4H70_24975 [Paenibacillus ehimensis]|uniref:hypothetical protein n=1 Tax=Paenibacillus ehimensis TaxID=79264 RepID=UPI002DBA5952|nr:hypothetical protein [Paenibacillus ehimensis]MEC0212202.1 hypothetical protein [Paenibacillus ehimensis]
MNNKYLQPPYRPKEEADHQPDRVKEEGPDDHYLPPRKTVHPTEKEKWLPYFYRSLLWIFILLVAGLSVWGWKLVML